VRKVILAILKLELAKHGHLNLSIHSKMFVFM